MGRGCEDRAVVLGVQDLRLDVGLERNHNRAGEVGGEIEKIYVENGQPVEYGQPLFGVRV